MAKQEKIVVEQIMDSVIKQSFELQRVGNDLGGKLAKDYDELAKELSNIAADYDLSSSLPPGKRVKMRNDIIIRGNNAITKSHQLMAANVGNQVVKVGQLETNFAAGSINKAATGKGTIAFANKTIGAERISKLSKNLIIRGAPQAKWWARQSLSLQNKFSDLITDGWVNNQDVATISQRIRGTAAASYKDGLMNVSKHQADSLARTSIASISNQVREETYLANSDVVRGVQFLAVLDGHTSDICRAYSGDKWMMDGEGWRNVEGGHEYRSPPLHFNCRSTLIPLLNEPRHLLKTENGKKKLAMVPKDKKKSLGEFIGPKVCHSPCKYQDPDLWLRDQPMVVQKDIMGKLHAAWVLRKLSVKKVITQKGRTRTVDELLIMVGRKDELVEGIEDLKTLDNLKASPTATGIHKAQVEKTTKAQFLGLERKIMAGEAVPAGHRDKLGRLLINIDPEDLEYKAGYHPDNLKDWLGSQDKRLAFYNHAAKKFERQSGWRKGDLSKRRTSALNSVDKEILNKLKTIIATDNRISTANKDILLQMYFESRHIIGTQRSLPMLESLITLARKKNFSDIDNFLAYWNNSMNTSINSYFSRATRLEVQLTANTTKAKRFLVSSKIAKDDIYGNINRSDPIGTTKVTLKESSDIKDKVSKIGKRKLRDFEGDVSSAAGVNLELSEGQSIELYLRYLQDKTRMNASEAKAWMKRTRTENFRDSISAADKKHLARVEFIVKRTIPGEEIIISDKILRSPLFKEWREEVWTGRGFSDKIKKEVGLVLVDAEIRQGLNAYLKNKIKYPTGVDQAEYLKKIIDAYIGKPTLAIVNRKLALREVERLYDLDGEARTVLRSKRATAAAKKLAADEAKAKKTALAREKLAEKEATYVTKKDTMAKRRARKADKESQQSIAASEREAVEESWKDMADAKYISETMESFDSLISDNAYRTSAPFYKEANLVKTDDSLWLAKFITKETLQSVQRGIPYTQAAVRLGEKYYFKTRGILAPDPEDALAMGNFLLQGILKTKVVKRVKGTQLLQEDFLPPRQITVHQLEVVSEEWREAVLANKTNYDIEGLPHVGRAPVVFDGVYEDATSLIRTSDKEFSAAISHKDRDKGWVRNLDHETKTSININGFTYDTLTELEKRGDSFIPTKVYDTGLDGVKQRSLRNSYDRARTIAKNVRDETFFNKMTADRYGRTYADTSAIHWQGDDFNKGMMRFKRGVNLGAKGYDDFARVFANTAGFDKIPMKSRIKILGKIDEDLILRTAKDPINNDWWRVKSDWIKTGVIKDLKGIEDSAAIRVLAREADPSGEGALQLLALIEERAKMIKHVRSGRKVDSFTSYLPMPADGTTNVLQHMGAISRDKATAKLVNMTKTKDVKDAYMAIRDGMDEIGRNLHTSDPLKILIDLPPYTPFGVLRKTVKHGLMTAQYNAGAKTLGRQYIDAGRKGFKKLAKSELDPIKKAEYEKIYKAFMAAKPGQQTQIGRYVLAETNEHFPAGLRVRNTLNKFAEAHQIAGKEIDFKIDVTGFPFKQNYMRMKTTQVELPTGDGKTITVNLQIATDKLDYSRQNIGFAPNFIHAMDAAHKSLTVNILYSKYGVRDFSMIHDSFGVHAGHGALLQKATKEAFLLLYKDKNVLRDLYYTFKRQGVDMSYFVRNAKGQKKALTLTYETRGEVPLYLRKYYERTPKGWEYKGKKYYDEEKDLYFAIDAISVQDIEKLGDYSFDQLSEAQYFFH